MTRFALLGVTASIAMTLLTIAQAWAAQPRREPAQCAALGRHILHRIGPRSEIRQSELSVLLRRLDQLCRAEGRQHVAAEVKRAVAGTLRRQGGPIGKSKRRDCPKDYVPKGAECVPPPRPYIVKPVRAKAGLEGRPPKSQVEPAKVR